MVVENFNHSPTVSALTTLAQRDLIMQYHCHVCCVMQLQSTRIQYDAKATGTPLKPSAARPSTGASSGDTDSDDEAAAAATSPATAGGRKVS